MVKSTIFVLLALTVATLAFPTPDDGNIKTKRAAKPEIIQDIFQLVEEIVDPHARQNYPPYDPYRPPYNPYRPPYDPYRPPYNPYGPVYDGSYDY